MRQFVCMKTLHAKSPCCKAKAYRFGGRRRQCGRCKRTWSIRPKKRGRKTIRVQPSIQNVAFPSQESLRHKATRLNKSRELIRRRHSKNIELLFKKLPKPKAPPGNLIAIIDGLAVNFKKERFTLYTILLRSIKDSKAVIMEPLLLSGNEKISSWDKAFQTLPKSVRRRIKAVVSDGITGIENYGKQQGWVVQRCHFHLIKMIQTLRGKSWRTIKDKELREDIYQKTRQLISTPDEKEARELYKYLNDVTHSVICPKWLGLRVRGGLKHWTLFRSYRLFPELKLPTTTNSAESVYRSISDITRQTRGFRNPKSFKKWIKLKIRSMREIRCNGYNYQQN